MANPTTVYGLPAPLLSGQADGPDGFQDLNDKLEVTLANLVQPFTDVLADFTMNTPGAIHDVGLASVPTGRVSLLLVTFNCRITSSGGQFAVYQIYDGLTLVTGDYSVQVPTGASSVVTPVTMVVARNFTNQPLLRASAGGSSDPVSTESLRSTGVGFAWPS